MKISHKVSVGALAISLLLGFALPVTALAATTPSLGVAAGYSLYGDAGVTNTGAGTHVWGNVGDNSLGHPGLLGSQVDGTIDAGAGVAGVAGTAYGALDAEGATGSLDLAGTHTVTPGVYTVGATTLNGTLTLDGAGVYIFRSDSSITTSGAGTVNLINGATACNVFWQVPTSMTIGAGSHVEGTIITQTGLISLATGATLKGRALAHTQVTLDSNQITEPTCGGTPPPPPPPSAPTCTLTANPTSVTSGSPSVLSWTTTNATSFSIDTSVGVVTPVASGSTSVSPITTTTYTGTATLTGGSSATCSATVAVTAPPAPTTATLHVIKIVVNGNGGTAVPANFSLHVKNAGTDVTGSPAAGAVAPGTSYTLTVGAYVVSEDTNASYTHSFSGDCDSGGSVTLSTGADKTCTITNTYLTQTVTTTTTIPSLPNTGLPPQSRTPWDIFITAGILMVVSSSLVFALKKRTM